jgi:hypothetical protein
MYIKCYCGHEVTAPVTDLPPSMVVESGAPKPEAIERLVCRHCGPRGRPAAVAIIWASMLDKNVLGR